MRGTGGKFRVLVSTESRTRCRVEGVGQARTVEGGIKRGLDWTGRVKTANDVAKDFIRGMLVVDPKARMSAQEALDHPVRFSKSPKHPLTSHTR